MTLGQEPLTRHFRVVPPTPDHPKLNAFRVQGSPQTPARLIQYHVRGAAAPKL